MIAAGQSDSQPSLNDSIPSIVEKVLDKKFSCQLNVDFGSSVNAYFTDSKFKEVSFKFNRLRLDLRGKISDQFSYRVRQSFNKSFTKASTNNIPPALEYANVQWHPNDKFKLTVGRQFLVIGGYEALANSMYVREFSDFNDNLAFYRVGVTGAIKLDKERNHELQLQLANNRNGKDNETYKYGFPAGVEPTKFPLITSVAWNGYFADKAVNLIYGASVAPIAKGRNLYYLSSGNIYEKGPIFAYIDIMYAREEIDTQQRITDVQSGSTPVNAQYVNYLSFIARFDYRFHPKWNFYVKGVYDTASVYKSNGIFNKGQYMLDWDAQACLEWYPLGRKNGLSLFAHYVYEGCELRENALNIGAVDSDIQRASLGILYVIPVL